VAVCVAVRVGVRVVGFGAVVVGAVEVCGRGAGGDVLPLVIGVLVRTGAPDGVLRCG